MSLVSRRCVTWTIASRGRNWMIFARTWEFARIAGRAWRLSGLSRSSYIDPDRYIPPHLHFALAWPRLLNSIPPRYVPAKIFTNVSCAWWGAGSLTRLGVLLGLGC